MEGSQKAPRERKRKNQVGSFKGSGRDTGALCAKVSACLQLVPIFEPFWDLDSGLRDIIFNFNHDLVFGITEMKVY